MYRDGVKVVDLWGGYRNGEHQDPWQQDTLVTVFSTTKGLASLSPSPSPSQQGLISHDSPVADYWPELLKPKDVITVRQLDVPPSRACP